MFKEIIQDFMDYRAWFKQWLFLKRYSIKMGLAINLADIKQKAFNRQYHIMLIALPEGDKLVSVSKYDINRLIRKKWLPKTINYFRLTHSESIFYSTPIARNNKCDSAEREKAKTKYLDYVKYNQ